MIGQARIGKRVGSIAMLCAAGFLAACGTGDYSGKTATASSTSSVPAPIPPVSPEAEAVGFVDVRTVVPDAKIDLRYATTDNFMGIKLYPDDARCMVHRDIADGLKTAADQLRSDGLRLIFWDCYRPHSAQVRMFEAVPRPGWVAVPGDYSASHESGRSVDIGLVRDGQLVDMGSGYDTFVPESNAYSELIDDSARQNRQTLIDAMAAGGLNVYDGEWWHFDSPDAYDHRPIIDVPVN